LYLICLRLRLGNPKGIFKNRHATSLLVLTYIFDNLLLVLNSVSGNSVFLLVDEKQMPKNMRFAKLVSSEVDNAQKGWK
jgi:hypothetical protein